MKDRGQKTGTQFLAGLAIGLCYVWLIVDARAASAASVSALGLCAKVIVPSLFPFFVCSNLFCALGLNGPWSGCFLVWWSRSSACRAPALRRFLWGSRADIRPARRAWARSMAAEASIGKRKKAASFLQQLRPCVYLRRCRAISLWKQPCGASSVSRACCIFPFARAFSSEKAAICRKGPPRTQKTFRPFPSHPR